MDDGSELFPGLRVGDVIAGKYRVERLLGVGGMGVVVAAHRVDLDQWVALKFLLPEMITNADAVSRFTREARASVKIQSEHVARVFDVGALETGVPYMVMEFLNGIDLGTWIAEQGVLPIPLAADFLLQACVAIAEAHGLGIVHRDIKPSNLFCVRGADGRQFIKVLDFGIAKVAPFSALGPGSTKTNAVVGSPLYMSPELTRSARDVDMRADIWALGIVLYELLTGRVPFQGDSVAEIFVKIAMKPPEPLRNFRPDVSESLDAVFLKCTEKDREQRYRNVAELALQLLPHAPRTSKALVEKVVGIVQSAGLSSTALSVPPSPKVAPTVSTTQVGLGSTARPPVDPGDRIPGRAKTAKTILVTGTVGVALLGGAFGARSLANGSGPRAIAPRPLPTALATSSDPAEVAIHRIVRSDVDPTRDASASPPEFRVSFDAATESPVLPTKAAPALSPTHPHPAEALLPPAPRQHSGAPPRPTVPPASDPLENLKMHY